MYIATLNTKGGATGEEWLIACYYHVMNAFPTDSILYICLNVKKLFGLNRSNI